MGKWAYIATTAGAPMSKTLALAEGTALFNGETTGIIHRSHYSGGRETPRITELEIGDELVLMYDFMDTGLVYPLARFEILDPNMPTNQTPLRNIGLRPQQYEGAPPLVVLQGGNQLQPDYIGNVDTGLNNDQEGRHLALIVRQLSAGPPKIAIGKIFRRDPKKKHNTILPWSDVTLCKEYDREFKDTTKRKEQLNLLVPNDINNKSKEKLNRLWGGSLDGRGKQLLINAKRLQEVSPGLVYNDFSNSTLSGYCLIALVEYEMLRLLKKKADIILKSSPDDKWSVDYLRLDTGNNHYTRLPLAPEGVDDKCNFSQLIHAIPSIAIGQYGAELIRGRGNINTNAWLRKWRDASYPILRARNRIAHSYYLQKVHFKELWRLVCGQDGILNLLHG